MNKLQTSIFLLAMAICGSVQATTITFGAGPTAATIQNSDGTVVPAGSLIWEGVFANAGSFAYNPALSVAANVTSIETANGWQQFGLNPSTQIAEAQTNTLAISNVIGNAKFGGQITDNNTGSPTASADFFNGKTLYIWVFNGTSIATSTQMGIFTASTWIFPTNTANSPVNSDTATLNSTNATAIASKVGSSTQGANTTPTVLNLAAAAVPEPTSLISLLGGGGVLALMRRRRTK